MFAVKVQTQGEFSKPGQIMRSFSFKYVSSVMTGIRANLRENDRRVGGQDSGDAEKIKIQVIYSGIPFYFTLFSFSTLHCAAVEKNISTRKCWDNFRLFSQNSEGLCSRIRELKHNVMLTIYILEAIARIKSCLLLSVKKLRKFKSFWLLSRTFSCFVLNYPKYFPHLMTYLFILLPL